MLVNIPVPWILYMDCSTYPASAAYLDQGNIAWSRSVSIRWRSSPWVLEEVISMGFVFRKGDSSNVGWNWCLVRKKTPNQPKHSFSVWYIYLREWSIFCGKCREIYHTLSVWEKHTHTCFCGEKKNIPGLNTKVLIGEYVVESSRQNPFLYKIFVQKAAG